jgi:hypothetical protein
MDTKPFILAAHERSMQGIRELTLDDPELEAVAGGDGTGKYCCIITPDAMFCDTDYDV